MRLRKWKLMLITAALAAGLGACKAPEQAAEVKTSAFPGTPEADMITLDVTSEPGEMNSLRVRDAISSSILDHCISGLFRLDAEDQPVADMAESYEISDDKTIYTIHLRKDGVWSNGEPVTADDFYFAWTYQMTPDSGSSYAPFLYENIKNGTEYYNGTAELSQVGIQVIDDYTLKIEWARPTPSGLSYLAMPAYYPVNRKTYESIGEADYAKDVDTFVTNGSYRMTEWVHNDHITLEKNEEHFRAAEISVPKLKLLMIGDESTRFNAFLAGQLDLSNIYSNHIEQLKGMGREAEAYIDGGSWYFNFNVQDKLMSNLNLRKALAYSVDMQSLLDNVINDGSVVADGLVPGVIGGAGGKTYASERGSLFAYDPDAAKTYLEQALTELGTAKEDLKIVLSVTDTSYSQTQAAYFQQQWKQNLDLQVELKVQDWKALYEDKDKGNFQFSCDAWGPDINDAMTFLRIFKTGDPTNYGRYSNPEFDRLIEAADVEADPQKRQELMIQAEKQFISDMAIGPMYFTCTSYALSDKVEGIVRTPFQMFSVLNGASIVKK